MITKGRIHKLFFPFLGIGALIWFLVRVIPKPSRAAYPCMRVAYPMASAFVVYLLGLAASAFAMLPAGGANSTSCFPARMRARAFALAQVEVRTIHGFSTASVSFREKVVQQGDG